MIPILYEANEMAFVSNGICRLQDCISCKATEGRNEVYEVEFEYPVDGMNFDKIQLGRIIAVTHDDTGDVQPFDIISCSRPINGVVTFRGVHISYRLNKISWTYKPTGVPTAIMREMNAQQWGFVFSTDIPSSGNSFTPNPGPPIQIRRYLGGMEGSMLDMFGGEYEFNRFNVILHRARGEKKDFAIRYGLNLVDYEEDIDYGNTFTKCMPYWLGSDGTVKTAGIVDSGMVPYNGIDNYPPLDLTDRFKNKPTTAQLKDAALSYMSTNKTYLPEQNIKVDFIRLQDTEEYKNFASLLSCKLCDTIEVIFPWYNVRADFKIVKVTWDVLAGKYESMELGDLQTSLAEALGVSASGSGGNGVELVTVTHEIIEDGTQSVSNYYNSTKALTKSGYMPLAVAGYNINGTNRKWMHLSTCTLVDIAEGSVTLNYFLSNTGSNAWAGALTVDILWLKI